MTVWSETHRQSEAAREFARPTLKSGVGLIEQYAKAVDAVSLWRAACGREAADHGFDSLRHGIAFVQRETADETLARVEAALALESASVRVNALGAALTLCASTGGDLFTQASRKQMHGRLMERYAELVFPDAERVRALAAE